MEKALEARQNIHLLHSNQLLKMGDSYLGMRTSQNITTWFSSLYSSGNYNYK